jgi:hypothetical protein
MDAEEFFNWIAYEYTQDKETRERLQYELKLDDLPPNEQEAERIRNFFKGMGTKQ